VAIAAGDKHGGHVIAEERDVGSVCAVLDRERSARAVAAARAAQEKQYGPVMTALTAKAKLAGLWVDQTANLNGNYAISDKPLTDEEWAERHTSKSCYARLKPR
jgi:hypothetical protein